MTGYFILSERATFLRSSPHEWIRTGHIVDSPTCEEQSVSHPYLILADPVELRPSTHRIISLLYPYLDPDGLG